MTSLFPHSNKWMSCLKRTDSFISEGRTTAFIIPPIDQGSFHLSLQRWSQSVWELAKYDFEKAFHCPPPHIFFHKVKPYSSSFKVIKHLHPASVQIKCFGMFKLSRNGGVSFQLWGISCYLQTGTRPCRCRWWAGSRRRQTRRRTPAWRRWGGRGWRWLWPASLSSAPLCSCHPGCSRANTHTVNILWKHI